MTPSQLSRLNADYDIDFTRTHLRRLGRAGKFPRPVRISENRIAWLEDEINAYVAQRIAERDISAK